MTEEEWEEHSILVAQRIRSWSANVVEKKHKVFNNLPACPFAKKSWLQHKVMIHVTESLDAVLEVKATNPPTQDMTFLFAWTNWRSMSQDDFSDFIYEQNDNHFGVWLAAFHPEAIDSIPMSTGESQDEIFSEVDDICIILMQEYDHLVKSAKQLEASGYYTNYTEAELSVLRDREEQLNAWKRQTKAWECEGNPYEKEWEEVH